MTRKIDRTVYDESHNPKADTGTAADVLNTVAAVRVTPDGAVSLHGDGHVEIYVNGKPSASMAPDARALTLESRARTWPASKSSPICRRPMPPTVRASSTWC